MIPLVLWWLCGLSFSAGGRAFSLGGGECEEKGEHPELHHFGVCVKNTNKKKGSMPIVLPSYSMLYNYLLSFLYLRASSRNASKRRNI